MARPVIAFLSDFGTRDHYAGTMKGVVLGICPDAVLVDITLVRLFMAPGMQHCGGGPGPNQVNYMSAMERWRESGIAPDRLIASRVSDNRVNMTRPVCPYPQVAQYTGVGSTNDAANFVCKVR